jgi:hypothetical protein
MGSIIADALSGVEWFFRDGEFGVYVPMFFSASRTDSGANRPRSRARKARTASGSVLAYSRRHQPMALRMKKSGCPAWRRQ